TEYDDAKLLPAVEAVIDYANKRHKRMVVNYSAGGYVGSTAGLEACQLLRQNGFLLCAAVGNNGSTPVYPAAYANREDGNVLGVGATSFRGLWSGSRPGATVVAPGDKVWSTWPTSRYRAMTGTSAATAFVSGVASLVWSQNPGFGPADVIDCIKRTA